MRKQKRDQLIAISFLLISSIFLYVELENISWLPDRVAQSSILIKGISFVLLSIAAILAGIAFENKRRIAIISGIVLAIGLGFLYLPVPLILRGSAFHLLFASAISFGMTTTATRGGDGCIYNLYLYRYRLSLSTYFPITWRNSTLPTSTRHYCLFDCLFTEGNV